MRSRISKQMKLFNKECGSKDMQDSVEKSMKDKSFYRNRPLTISM